MRKLYRLLLILLLTVHLVEAQSFYYQSKHININSIATVNKTKPVKGFTFYCEDFSSGSNTLLPAGWTATSTLGSGTWKWINQASSSFNSIGSFQSPSASNGWLIYDCDSIAGVSGINAAPSGQITSPSINCSGHPYVQLSFYQKFRSFLDSCFVDVSANNGLNWSTIDFDENNKMSTNVTTTDPELIVKNISAIAGNSAQVKIRFRYKSSPGGAFSWLIDDVCISDMDSVDAAVTGSFIYYSPDGVNFSSFYSMPYALQDSIGCLGMLSNKGILALPGVDLELGVVNSVYTLQNNQVNQYAFLPYAARDSFFNFPAGILMPNNSQYKAGISSLAFQDGNSSNNSDTIQFQINDSVFSHNLGAVTGGLFAHLAQSAVNQEQLNLIATEFDIPVNKSDTLTAMQLALINKTTVGAKIRAILYKNVAGSWQRHLYSNYRIISAADLSSDTLLKIVRIPFYFNNNLNSCILQSGKYRLALDVQQVLPNENVVILSTQKPAIFTVGYYDAFANEFNAAQAPLELKDAPFLQLIFGNPQLSSGPDIINEFGSAATYIKVYPIPANEILNCENHSTKAINCTIFDIYGRTVQQFELSERQKATIDIKSWPEGMYFVSSGQQGAVKFQVYRP